MDAMENLHMAQQISAEDFQMTRKGDDLVRVRFPGAIDMPLLSALSQKVLPDISKRPPEELLIDMAQVPYLDDFGLTALFELKQAVAARRGRVRILNAGRPIREVLQNAQSRLDGECRLDRQAPPFNLFERFGEILLREVNNLRYMTSFVGSVCLALGKIALNPRSLRTEDTITAMEKIGVDAVPIVGLISFLMGLIIAFMSSLQLRQFGADLYVASLVALAMVSELGPIMTAIIVAGRSGSSFAAEIGSMRISEEIDALFVMGYDPTLFLAAPRVIAAVIMVPLLTLFANFFAIAGGLMVGVFILDLTPGAYVSQTLEALSLFEVLWGMLKALIFALLIAWTGCLRGFQVRGGAAGVGGAATSAVVTSIFFIILFDSIFAVIRSYW